ncbi:MAG: hypothetical protein JWQ04_2879 [Pedosphaera sp.]|nr:hypothetical protein [Pedosphaera sp.]
MCGRRIGGRGAGSGLSHFDGNGHFRNDHRPREGVDRVLEELATFGLQNSDDQPGLTAHSLERLAILIVDFRVEWSPGHFAVAGGDDENGDNVGGFDDFLHGAEGQVEAAGFSERLMPEKISCVPGDLCGLRAAPSLHWKIGINIVIESPEAEGIAGVHLAAGAVDDEAIEEIEDVRPMAFHGGGGVHDEQKSVGRNLRLGRES